MIYRVSIYLLGSWPKGKNMSNMKLASRSVWSTDVGQDIAEYTVVLVIICVLVFGMTRLIGR